MTRIGRVGKPVCADAALAVSKTRPAIRQPMRLAIIARPAAFAVRYPPARFAVIGASYRALDVEQSMDFDLSERSREWRDRLQTFFQREVLPRHRDWSREVAADGKASFMPELQRKARAAGLWNLALPELADGEPGTRLSNLD